MTAEHSYICTCQECVDAGDGIPRFLRRYEHVTADLYVGIDLAKPGSDHTVYNCSCGLMSGECKRAGCPTHDSLLNAVRASGEVLYDVTPAEALPASTLPWLLPSGSKSEFPGA